MHTPAAGNTLGGSQQFVAEDGLCCVSVTSESAWLHQLAKSRASGLAGATAILAADAPANATSAIQEL